MSKPSSFKLNKEENQNKKDQKENKKLIKTANEYKCHFYSKNKNSRKCILSILF